MGKRGSTLGLRNGGYHGELTDAAMSTSEMVAYVNYEEMRSDLSTGYERATKKLELDIGRRPSTKYDGSRLEMGS